MDYSTTPEKIKKDYGTLMGDFNTSKKAAEDALKAAKERGGEMQDYKLTEDEYKHIEIYYQKILELKKLSEYINYHYNKTGDKKYLDLGLKWFKEYKSYHDEAVSNEIHGAFSIHDEPPLKRGGGKTKKKRKQRSNKSKKKRKRRRGKKSNKSRTRKYN